MKVSCKLINCQLFKYKCHVDRKAEDVEKGTVKYTITYEDLTTIDTNIFTDNGGGYDQTMCFTGYNSSKSIKSIELISICLETFIISKE
jgi:hypothetical protein